jgi:uncharacterized phage infection (PIP) family protein YhgE
VPRKPKISQELNSRAEPGAPATNQETTVVKNVTGRSSTASKKPKAGQKKISRKPTATSASAAQSADAADPTDEAIRLRAYFISERRRRFALPGDTESDWLEAKRQLLSELGPR